MPLDRAAAKGADRKGPNAARARSRSRPPMASLRIATPNGPTWSLVTTDAARRRDSALAYGARAPRCNAAAVGRRAVYQHGDHFRRAGLLGRAMLVADLRRDFVPSTPGSGPRRCLVPEWKLSSSIWVAGPATRWPRQAQAPARSAHAGPTCAMSARSTPSRRAAGRAVPDRRTAQASKRCSMPCIDPHDGFSGAREGRDRQLCSRHHRAQLAQAAVEHTSQGRLPSPDGPAAFPCPRKRPVSFSPAPLCRHADLDRPALKAATQSRTCLIEEHASTTVAHPVDSVRVAPSAIWSFGSESESGRHHQPRRGKKTPIRHQPIVRTASWR